MSRPRVAVVGTGMAGAACAARLARADVEVVLFDKARGVGGRLATRRVVLPGPDGTDQEVAFDHGAPFFTARSPGFAAAVDEAAGAGWLVPWSPRWAPDSFQPLEQEAAWLAQPRMTRWCAQLCAGVPVHLNAQVVQLVRRGGRWAVHADAPVGVVDGFTHVVVAVPPAQAAPWLLEHRPDWAHEARHWALQPCWTWLGVAEHTPEAPAWDVCRPPRGPLAWLLRQDTRPGRAAPPGWTPWVAHATAEWSRLWLEAAPEAVEAALRPAVQALLGEGVRWRGSWVHRWRYAQSARSVAAQPAPWCDDALGLAVAGDYLGGGGVEGAWRSGQAVAEHWLATLAGDAGRPGA
ncbi:NAD(P)/FAD-dependent oxidoreductase [Ideonella sp.]|uniref:NAD(P)/FAD-dependent oxidoreductase n=1 Tax=Ideonella sp. TaxID=1929293 RepID=UPI0035AE1BCC